MKANTPSSALIEEKARSDGTYAIAYALLRLAEVHEWFGQHTVNPMSDGGFVVEGLCEGLFKLRKDQQ
jgi:hypothetical protein